MSKKKSLKPIKIILSIFLILFLGFSYFEDRYVINVTKSLPIGLYKLSEIDSIKRGDIVFFKAKEEIFNFMIERGYISKEISSFIKRVEGVEGDSVAVGDYLEINGIKVKSFLPNEDSIGRSLYKKTGNYHLKEGEYFLVGDTMNSFDSSYMGIINRGQIKYKANLIFKFCGGRK
ncbi:signal peptidase I [Cetobacterium sp. 2A]|uniref:signal peptidase I n=1 Tax=Cetobacterium sp. 2A TaxID=2754723 RepID=UPI00163D081B|nr:signal peptidase I [Cetobacterium sp. 2A]MBC2857029.1 signal peptidase I [Cetobacterium sp. 2A]